MTTLLAKSESKQINLGKLALCMQVHCRPCRAVEVKLERPELSASRFAIFLVDDYLTEKKGRAERQESSAHFTSFEEPHAAFGLTNPFPYNLALRAEV